MLQAPNMKEAEREAFLEQFEAPAPGIHSRILRLGGIYSEGIDLKGDRLIGSIIVGVGLPQINPEQEVIRAYFEGRNHMGFAYAYQIPGMNKVHQAAGRVIRDDTDRGAGPADRRPLHYLFLPPPAAGPLERLPGGTDPIGGFQPDPVVLGGTALCGRYSGASGRSHHDSQQPHAVGQALLIQGNGIPLPPSRLAPARPHPPSLSARPAGRRSDRCQAASSAPGNACIPRFDGTGLSPR